MAALDARQLPAPIPTLFLYIDLIAGSEACRGSRSLHPDIGTRGAQDGGGGQRRATWPLDFEHTRHNKIPSLIMSFDDQPRAAIPELPLQCVALRIAQNFRHVEVEADQVSGQRTIEPEVQCRSAIGHRHKGLKPRLRAQLAVEDLELEIIERDTSLRERAGRSICVSEPYLIEGGWAVLHDRVEVELLSICVFPAHGAHNAVPTADQSRANPKAADPIDFGRLHVIGNRERDRAVAPQTELSRSLARCCRRCSDRQPNPMPPIPVLSRTHRVFHGGQLR